MKSPAQRVIIRWIHIVFGLPLIGYVYGPNEEVQQYAYMFKYIFMPVLLLSGLWMWKGQLVMRLFSKNAG